MVKNQSDTWLALLILKSTRMNGIDRSPAELLCNRCFRTTISMIKHARLHNEDSTKCQNGSKELVPLNLGSRILYDKSPDSTKRPEWSKGIVKDIEGPSHKYTIGTETGKNVTRTRCDIRPDGLYVTQSGRISRSPDCLIAKM